MNEAQLRTMLGLQYDLNKAIFPDFLERKLPYYRATWIEAGELMDHVGYKWWKKRNDDLSQARLELVDMWHFILSELMVGAYVLIKTTDRDRIIETAIDMVLDDVTSEMGVIEGVDVLDLIEQFTCNLLQTRLGQGANFCSDISMFRQLCLTLGLTDEQLFLQYIGKNTLNHFRQQHGYKEGTYRKNTWGMSSNQEDNEFLTDVLNAYQEQLLSSNPEEVSEKVYDLLRINYPKM
jgi:dimeric dUTPase (all-alpha-NTP-PPase superfamily)